MVQIDRVVLSNHQRPEPRRALTEPSARLRVRVLTAIVIAMSGCAPMSSDPGLLVSTPVPFGNKKNEGPLVARAPMEGSLSRADVDPFDDLGQLPEALEPSDKRDGRTGHRDERNGDGREAQSNSAIQSDQELRNLELTAEELSLTSIWSDLGREGQLWTHVTVDALKTLAPNLIAGTPSDVASYCPNYSNLSSVGRLTFWTNFIATMSFFESGFDPKTKHQEDFRDSTGERIVSRGLLQISIESARAQGCRVSTAEDLHKPEMNLRCGVRLLERFIRTDGKIFGMTSVTVDGKTKRNWLGVARYWGIFRSQSKHRSIRTSLRSSDYCREIPPALSNPTAAASK